MEIKFSPNYDVAHYSRSDQSFYLPFNFAESQNDLIGRDKLHRLLTPNQKIQSVNLPNIQISTKYFHFSYSEASSSSP